MGANLRPGTVHAIACVTYDVSRNSLISRRTHVLARCVLYL